MPFWHPFAISHNHRMRQLLTWFGRTSASLRVRRSHRSQLLELVENLSQQVCNIPIFNLDVYNRSFICIHDLCIFAPFVLFDFWSKELWATQGPKERVGSFPKTHFWNFKVGIWIKLDFTENSFPLYQK